MQRDGSGVLGVEGQSPRKLPKKNFWYNLLHHFDNGVCGCYNEGKITV